MNFLGPVELETVQKIDFYATLHKGVRRALFEASRAIAIADPAAEEEVVEALDKLHAVLKLMGKLGGVEAARIHGFLETFRPGATQAAQADSQRQTLAVGALLRLEKEARLAKVRERRELLMELSSSYTGFLGEALLHMADAELELMPLLRETGTYEELAALRRNIFADLGRDTVVAMVREIVPATGKRECLEFLQIVQRAAPSSVWPSVWWAVCALLSQDERADFSRVLGVDCAQMPLGQTF